MLYIKGQGMVEGDPLEQWAPYSMGGPLPVQAKTSVVTFQADGDELQVILEALSNVYCYYCESTKPANGGSCCHIANLRAEQIALAEDRMFRQAKTYREGRPHLIAVMNATATVSIVKHAA